MRRRALDVLCSDELSDMVEMVVFSPEPGVYEARAVDGAVTFTRRPDGGRWTYVTTAVTGRDPLGDQDPARFSPVDSERSHLQPPRHANSYPLAFERIAQVFDHPCAPDLCVLHTAAHRPTAHRGEHGSLGVIQSRAPFVAAGPGIASRGLVPGHCATVDLAPTVLAMLGARPGPGTGPTGAPSDDCLLARQDGRVLSELFDQGDRSPDHVVVVLMDGANANVLYAAAAAGTMPHVAGLIERGTALAEGCIASLPSVTLANHTSLNTGVHPGHHGVLHNAWYDRANGHQVVTESPATWQESMRWLFPGVETIHEAVHRHRPGAVSVSINEPADRGSDYSTMELMRRGEIRLLFEGTVDPLPHADPDFMGASDDYRWGSLADDGARRQAVAVWDGSLFDVDYEIPTFTWVSFSLTDAAFHEGGPHSDIAAQSLRDTDARLGDVLDAVARRGALDRTAVLIVADHGMEETAPDVVGDWGDALRSAGIEHRDEASGFVYLGVPPDERGS
jgi:hypothetical protein